MTKLESSIIHAYEERGPWGKRDFRGNVSGFLIWDLMDTYPITNIMDPMDGSGTTRDVALARHIPYLGYDLDRGDDLFAPSVRLRIREQVAALTDGLGMDFIFWHPPYWSMVMYHAGDPRDLSSMPYIMFVQKMKEALRYLGEYLRPGGRIAILIGDYRRQGKYYWMLRDFLTDDAMRAAHLQIDTLFVREQFNVMSGSDAVASNVVRLMHEYVAVLVNPVEGSR